LKTRDYCLTPARKNEAKSRPAPLIKKQPHYAKARLAWPADSHTRVINSSTHSSRGQLCRLLKNA
jgi:hypothetical protein